MAKNKGNGNRQPTNGPYHWGNGPQPKRCCFYAEGAKAVWMGKFRLGARFFGRGIRHTFGLI